MIIRECDSWQVFLSRLEDYYRRSAVERERFIFRGQADAGWVMQTTLQRYVQRIAADARPDVAETLLARFKRESVGLLGARRVGELADLEFVGRHHGLPSRILDWTRSVFVASLFALEDWGQRRASHADAVAVFALDRSVFDRDARGVDYDAVQAAFEILDDVGFLEVEPRAVEQQSVFMRVADTVGSIEELLGDYLRKFILPAKDAPAVLDQLADMGLTRRALFRDLGAAASTAQWRVSRMLMTEATHG